MPCGCRALAISAFALCFAAAAHSQIRQNAPVDVLGQVYAPGGGTLQQQVRIHFTSARGFRPPEILFSDSNGRFVIYSLIQGEDYTLRIDEEAPFWAATSTTFTPFGRKPTVHIYLNPYSRPATRPPATSGARGENRGAAVTAAELRADIPRAARREFEQGLERLAAADSGKARKNFERAIALHPEFVEARNELAVLLMRDGELAAAEALLRRTLELDPAAALPLMNLGLCIYRQERYREAAAPLERAVQLEPENYRSHLLLGMTLVMAGDDPRAEPALLRAYELAGARAARAQFYLSHYYTRKKDYRRAARALETYLTDAPTDPNAPALTQTLAKLRATSAKN